MSVGRYLGLWGCCLVAACGSSEPISPTKGEGSQELCIISVENATQSVIRRIIVLDAHSNVRQQHAILRDQEVSVAPGVHYPIFLQMKVCELIIKVEYLDGNTSEGESQDFCRQSQIIFRESSVEIPERTVIVAKA